MVHTFLFAKKNREFAKLKKMKSQKCPKPPKMWSAEIFLGFPKIRSKKCMDGRQRPAERLQWADSRDHTVFVPELRDDVSGPSFPVPSLTFFTLKFQIKKCIFAKIQ